ncbi:SWIM-type domain-containing protein [Citrus sinensis]|uniref:SWIM-type domain-containing protein n=1 Tax=Citrus sinensis TaxID=2711 RepID=A0ACB8NGF2_CITSI|nr:SWIM-type domain-containing protein [Citrus sinensis]
MKLVPHNSSQSRTKQNLIPRNDTNIQTGVSDDEASNSSLYEDFLDTYFRSPSCYEKSGLCSGNRTKQPTVDLAANDENEQLYHTPSDQQRQPFLNSQCLSPLLHQILPPYVPTTHDEIPISQPQIPSQPNTQKPTEPSHDCDDSVYSLSASDDDVYNQPTELGQNANEVELFRSDDDDVDELLSSYSSDDNEFGACSDEDGDRVMDQMDSEMRADMYIPRDDQAVEFFVGQYFKNFTELTIALRKFAVKERFKTSKQHFERTRISVGCEGVGCPWYLHASRTRFGDIFMVRSYYNVHTCQRLWKNPECTAQFIASQFQDTILANPETNVSFIQSELDRMYGCRVDKQKVYRAKKIALQSCGADYESSYKLIRSYAQMVLNRMPDALAIVHVIRLHGNQPKTHFDRCILSFPALREGFKRGCRPFIGIDGCHLKGPYKGVLLSAVALDANTGIYPIAVCVCTVESTSTWTWFLGHLKDYIKDSRQLTFMCDRQKGIQNALGLEFPNANVRYCARHILANLKAKHPRTDFKKGFWEASRAANVIDFQKGMEKVRAVDPACYETLRRIHPRFWSRHAFDRVSKSDHCTNNMTESFNAWIGVHRKLPLLTLLEFIRKKMMKRMINRRRKAEAWGSEIARKVYGKMQKNLQLSRGCAIMPASEWMYEVDDHGRTYIVDLEHHSCDCGFWDVSGYPCIHAMPCIIYSQKSQEDFVSQCFKKEAYLKSYSGMIQPIPDKASWPEVHGDEILPPLLKRPPGRPKLNRRREPDEVPPEKKRYKMCCKCCGQFGHNKRGCPVNPANVNKKTRHYKNNVKAYSESTARASEADFGPQKRSIQQDHNKLKAKRPTNQSHCQGVNVPQQAMYCQQQLFDLSVHSQKHIGSSSGTVRMLESSETSLGVQGKRIMQDCTAFYSGSLVVNDKAKTKALDKGKAPAFPPSTCL